VTNKKTNKMQMKRVGLTGNIGSGKTTVCKVFEVLGIPVFYADEEAKKILHNPEVIAKITVFLGDDIIDDNGLPIRSRIAEKVFNNKELLLKLNSVIHPFVINTYNNWLEDHENFPYTIKEAAILFESGYYKDIDKIIVVASDEKLMIERVAKRDNVNFKDVEARLRNQMSQDEKIIKANYVIKNYGDFMIIPQVLEIHANLIGA
jgi:dephospho-CoA kinase